MIKNKNIFIVSNEPWGETWYSKHNYAWELSTQNKVFFINPPVAFKLSNLFNNRILETKINDSLSILTYKNILPVRFELTRKINEFIVFKKLKRIIDSNQLKELIFWTFDPIRLSNPKQIKPALIILHMVDKYLFTTKAEFEIAKNSDIILCVAQEIADGYYKLNNSVHVVPHAIPEDEFLPIKNNSSKQIVGVYVGNIDLRIDFNYQRYIIEKFPNLTFEFVGKQFVDNIETYGIFEGKYKNVICRGEQPFKSLKYYIQNSDFCFVFKDINHPGNNISSHKMLQYFAQGKPIFTTEMTRYQSIKDLLFMENDMVKMADLIQNFIDNGDTPGASDKRIAYASAFSFKNILEQIEKLINDK